jgi:hypothetical protein
VLQEAVRTGEPLLEELESEIGTLEQRIAALVSARTPSGSLQASHRDFLAKLASRLASGQDPATKEEPTTHEEPTTKEDPEERSTPIFYPEGAKKEHMKHGGPAEPTENSNPQYAQLYADHKRVVSVSPLGSIQRANDNGNASIVTGEVSPVRAMWVSPLGKRVENGAAEPTAPASSPSSKRSSKRSSSTFNTMDIDALLLET